MDAQQIAHFAGTISYNVLCGIGARVRRVYVP
ncbi:MAG: alanine racemase C-terminal domain-containing protein [Bryobacteraceae bacterium]